MVALLSGRNFETKQYEEQIIEESFAKLKEGILDFINETNFKNFIIIIRSAGFVDSSMIFGQNALNFAYVLYLTLREMHFPFAEIERYVRRWYVMSTLTGRYSSSPETAFDRDIRQIYSKGIQAYLDEIVRGELSEAFWETVLPGQMDASSDFSPYFRVYKAAQVKRNDKGFLSRDVTVRELIEVKSDVHHVFPKDYLKKNGFTKNQYNQIANYVLAQTEINLAIGNKEPSVYFKQLIEQCKGGPKVYGNICDLEELKENLRDHCIPEGIEDMTYQDYPYFLKERRILMARKIRNYFENL